MKSMNKILKPGMQIKYKKKKIKHIYEMFLQKHQI